MEHQSHARLAAARTQGDWTGGSGPPGIDILVGNRCQAWLSIRTEATAQCLGIHLAWGASARTRIRVTGVPCSLSPAQGLARSVVVGWVEE